MRHGTCRRPIHWTTIKIEELRKEGSNDQSIVGRAHNGVREEFEIVQTGTSREWVNNGDV